MDNKKYLNEEKYQKTEKIITTIAFLILILGLSLGGYLIYRGINKPDASKVEALKENLEKIRNNLEAKDISYDAFAKYTDGEKYDLKIVTDALDPSFSHCSFEEYKNNSLTKKYCAAKNKTGSFASIGSIMIGAFICIFSCMFSFSLFMIAKRRHVLAFATQQAMPIAKEGISEMTPTIANVAEEITKGIKKGLNDKK